jgi:hypothetical protein
MANGLFWNWPFAVFKLSVVSGKSEPEIGRTASIPKPGVDDSGSLHCRVALKLHWFCTECALWLHWNQDVFQVEFKCEKHSASQPGPQRSLRGDYMIPALSIIAVLGIIIFLSGALFGVFVLLIMSMRRTARVPLSYTHDERAGAISRRVLVGARAEGREISQ